MLRWIKRLLMGAVAVAVAGVIVYGFLPQPVPADVETIGRGALQVSVSEDGKTRIKDRYVISAPISGQLLRIELEPGDEITARQTVVAQLEPEPPAVLDDRTRAQAVAKENASRIHLDKVSLVEETVKKALTNAEVQLSRVKNLKESNATSQESVEVAELEFARRKEEFSAARLAVEIAKFELEWAKMALLEASQFNDPRSLGEQRTFAIQSPISGRVLKRYQESAAVIRSGASILEVGDPTRLEIEVDVLSTDAVKIPQQANVVIEHWGGGKPLQGVVRRVEPQAFTKISALGVEEQRVWVIIDLLDPPEERPSLGDGYRIEARIILWDNADVLKVPTSALFRRGTDWAVFRVVENRAVLTTIKLGQRNGLEAQVLEGLSAGDRVVIHPSDRVAEGMQLVPRTE